MYLTDALGAIARRWYVVLAGLGLLGLLAHAALTDVHPDYQANGQLVLLLPPSATGADNPTSPYLNVPSGLTSAAVLVSDEVTTDDAVQRMAARGRTATFSVSVLPSAGPIVVVTAKGTDPAEVLRTRDAVMASVATQLALVQDGAQVPDNQRIYTEAVATDTVPQRLSGSKVRALIGITGAGGLGLLLVVGAVDRWALWRRRRSSGSTGWVAGTEEPRGSGSATDALLAGSARR